MSALVGDQWKISRAQQVRDAMGPEMCAVADALRETFGARLTWLEAETMQIGSEPDWGVPTQWHGTRR